MTSACMCVCTDQFADVKNMNNSCTSSWYNKTQNTKFNYVIIAMKTYFCTKIPKMNASKTLRDMKLTSAWSGFFYWNTAPRWKSTPIIVKQIKCVLQLRSTLNMLVTQAHKVISNPYCIYYLQNVAGKLFENSSLRLRMRLFTKFIALIHNC